MRSIRGDYHVFPEVEVEYELFGLQGEGVGVEELEWEQEVNRSSAEYARWIQTSLNKIQRLRLAVDGIVGPKTRSAIRSFQKSRGLEVDGIVGPITEAALIAAGAAPPPGYTSPGTPAPTPSIPTTPYIPTPGTGTLRGNIARIALEEHARWNYGSAKEWDSGVQGSLRDYWVTGVGSDSGYRSKAHWSAAFISWVVRKAGAGDMFKYAADHGTYIVAAKENRLANNSNPFKAYRTTEVAPRVGDLVCTYYTGYWTYDNVTPGPGKHCDIVTEVASGKIITIGGNVSDSVGKKTVSTDANGYISNSKYFAVIRVDA